MLRAILMPDRQVHNSARLRLHIHPPVQYTRLLVRLTRLPAQAIRLPVLHTGELNSPYTASCVSKIVMERNNQLTL